MYKKFFCTFADSRLQRSLARIKQQADNMGVYDVVFAYDENNLALEFKERFKERLILGSKGFGYWVWKPQIILQAFEKMDYGDVLNYCDAGCWLNPQGIQRLLEYFDLTEFDENGILSFQVKNTFNDPILEQFSLPEYKWTKGDLFDYFNVRQNITITNSEQIGATILFIKKSKFSEKFVKEWLNVFEQNFELADDSPSVSDNFDGFIEHRHDQSIFGILCKIYGVRTISAFEYWYPSEKNIKKPNWSKLKNYPIWAKRDKNFGLILKLKMKSYKLISKLNKLGLNK